MREGAFIILYQTLFGQTPQEITEADEEAFGLARSHETDLIVNGVLSHDEEITGIIAKYSTTRSVARISKVNLIIMKIAIYEIKYDDKVPGAAAINEAVELAKRQVGNVGGYPYWSWYGFDSRVEWCACFVSWCYNQAGKSEPRFAGCEWQGVPWFQSHGQWGARGYNNLAPGDAIFFDWDLDGTADHVGIVIGTDGSRVYTVEGNSGDACKIKSYDLNYQSIKGYGLMNW